MAEAAAGPWTDRMPNGTGLFLVQYLNGFFPAGNPNNITIQLVHIVYREGTQQRIVLSEGREVEASERDDWKWAKVSPARTA